MHDLVVCKLAGIKAEVNLLPLQTEASDQLLELMDVIDIVQLKSDYVSVCDSLSDLLHFIKVVRTNCKETTYSTYMDVIEPVEVSEDIVKNAYLNCEKDLISQGFESNLDVASYLIFITTTCRELRTLLHKMSVKCYRKRIKTPVPAELRDLRESKTLMSYKKYYIIFENLAKQME